MKEAIYVVKSKKSGNYFQFEQYYDDGWGEYVDYHSKWYKGKLWSERDYKNIQSGALCICDFNGHTKDELEWVRIEAEEK